MHVFVMMNSKLLKQNSMSDLSVRFSTTRILAIVMFLMAAASCSLPQESVPAARSSGWVKLGPGGGGATFIPTFSYTTADKFMVRCDMTGSYITNDGGMSYEQVNFPNGAHAFAYDPNNASSMWIGASTLNHSKDGGKTWTRVFPEAQDIIAETFHDDHASYRIEVATGSLYPGGHINAIVADTQQKGRVYFSMGAYFFYSDSSGALWKRLQVGDRISKLYTDEYAYSDSVIIFGSDSLFYFNKLSRTHKAVALPKAMQPAFSFSAGRTKDGSYRFYALHNVDDDDPDDEFGNSEVWTSTDGQHWQVLRSNSLTNVPTGRMPSYSMIACAERDAAQAYLVTNRYEEKKDNKVLYWYGALKTSDAGANWDWAWKGGGGSGQYGVKDGVGVDNLTDAWTEEAFGGEYIRLMDVGVYPADGSVAIVTDWYRTMKTTDGGKSWREIYSERQDNGTYRSRGLDVTTAYSVHFDPFDADHIAISYTDIGYHHSFDGGKSWKRATDGVPAEWVNTCYDIVFDPAVKDRVWSVWSGLHDFPRGKMTRDPNWRKRAFGGVCRSDDGGKTWRPLSLSLSPTLAATSIVLDPSSSVDNRTLYMTAYGNGVYKSTDGGETWHQKNSGIGENNCAFELTRAGNGNLFLTVSATPAHKDGKRGREYHSGAVYRSTDGAETWTPLNIADGPLFPNGIGIAPDDPNRIYLACWSSIELSDLVGGSVARATGGPERIDMPGGIFLSEDGGNTWTPIFDKRQYVYDVTTDPRHPERVYCNTFNADAWRSDDRGATWKKIKGYDFHWGQRVVIDEHHDENVYLTTFGSSVLRGVPVTE